ncbi:MAG: hypothetical protein QOI10_185 [Solirubrobacterales bacterium]|nr:hypothetical protein [Solirubrobacterales bacterium]
MAPDIGRTQAAERLRRAAARLDGLAADIESGQAERDDIDAVSAEIAGAAADAFGPRGRAPRGKGAKAKILRFLLDHLGDVVHGDELAAASGIQEWARRVRELRVEDGYEIAELGGSRYRLESLEPDLQRAAQWKTANVIRRQPGSGMDRVAAFLETNVGLVVTRDQIDYVSKIAEGSRRVRELRDEHGWPINSHIDEPELQPGECRLTSTDPADRRDPLQRLYPESLRQTLFERDNYTCQECQRNRAKALAAGDTRFYLELHHKVAVADELAALPKAERNNPDNLVTLCHTDHLKSTAELQRTKRRSRRAG